MLDTFTLSKRIVTLIAPSFEEGFTIYCLDRMREEKLPASLVGISKGLIRGLHGIHVQPDYTLDQVDQPSVGMVIIPGNRNCSARLLSDPRVHRLLENTVMNGGYIAILKSAQALAGSLRLAELGDKHSLLRQGTLSTAAFTNQLINIWREPLLSPNGHLRSVPQI